VGLQVADADEGPVADRRKVQEAEVLDVQMTVALWRAVRDDWGAGQRRERELRRRMRELVGGE